MTLAIDFNITVTAQIKSSNAAVMGLVFPSCTGVILILTALKDLMRQNAVSNFHFFNCMFEQKNSCPLFIEKYLVYFQLTFVCGTVW